MNRRRISLAAAILVWTAGLALSVRAAHAQEDGLEYARLLLAQGREGEAIGQFEVVLRDPERERDALRHLVDLYAWNERPRDQARAYARLLELDPERLDLRRALADLYFELDSPAEGVHQLERILEARPGDLELRRELANHYFWSDRPAEGISQLERILEARPGDLELRRELANHYIWSDRPAEGISQLERLVAMDGTDLSARLRLAQALAWSDQPDRALLQLDVILARTPDEPEALFLAGELRRWKAVGWYRGKEHLHRLLDQEPEHPHARRLLKELRAEWGPMVAPSVSRLSDSNGLTTTRLSLEVAAWMAGNWRLGLHSDRSTLTDRREPGAPDRSIHGLSTEIVRSFPRGGTLRGRMGFSAAPDSWTPITGQLEYSGRVSQTVSASVSAALRPVLGSTLSIDRRILERLLAAEGNVRPSERLEFWGMASWSSFTDENRGVMGAVGGKVSARLAAPSVALFGSYTYEDTEIVHADSRPYWTPRDLSTLDAGIELADSPVPWADLALRLGLSRQDRTSYTYDVGIRLTPGGYHNVDIGFGRWGSDVYSSTHLSLRYSYRLDFL